VMVSQLEIWRAANVLVKHYGAEAPVVAAKRANALLGQGDKDGHAVWLGILRAVKELRWTALREGESVN
jgi:hypothetical protein